jgi:hypothetical protein
VHESEDSTTRTQNVVKTFLGGNVQDHVEITSNDSEGSADSNNPLDLYDHHEDFPATSGGMASELKTASESEPEEISIDLLSDSSDLSGLDKAVTVIPPPVPGKKVSNKQKMQGVTVVGSGTTSKKATRKVSVLDTAYSSKVTGDTKLDSDIEREC